MTDNELMGLALQEAEKALAEGEVPVGAVVAQDGKVLATGHNMTVQMKDPSAHAEILAIRRACAAAGDFRIPGAQLYVTIEPCPMCSGAVILSRIQRLVYGASETRTGSAGTVFSILANNPLNPGLVVEGGLLASRSLELLQEFFRSARARRKDEKIRLRDALTPEEREAREKEAAAARARKEAARKAREERQARQDRKRELRRMLRQESAAAGSQDPGFMPPDAP